MLQHSVLFSFFAVCPMHSQHSDPHRKLPFDIAWFVRMVFKFSHPILSATIDCATPHRFTRTISYKPPLVLLQLNVIDLQTLNTSLPLPWDLTQVFAGYLTLFMIDFPLV
jgi:hypothetical protein